MNYEKKSFSVPASAGTAAYCAAHGHTMPDVRGKCVRCGNPAPWFEYKSMLCGDYTPEPSDFNTDAT